MKKKAFVPLSINNDLLTTEKIVDALSEIPDIYDEVIFLFFDQLHLYNKIVPHALKDIAKEFIFNSANDEIFLIQRKNWLRKIKSKIFSGPQKANWESYNVHSFADFNSFSILRNIYISFHSLPDFKEDIQNAAKNYFERKQIIPTDRELRLSESYLLEEIALNIRVRVLEQVEDEFYTGYYLLPLVKLYEGFYEVDVFSLAGKESQSNRFNFFNFVRGINNIKKWELLTLKNDNKSLIVKEEELIAFA